MAASTILFFTTGLSPPVHAIITPLIFGSISVTASACSVPSESLTVIYFFSQSLLSFFRVTSPPALSSDSSLFFLSSVAYTVSEEFSKVIKTFDFPAP